MTIYIHRGGLVLLMTLFCMGFFSITLLQAEAAQSITEKYQIKNGQWRTESSLDDSSGRLNPGKGSNNPGRDEDDEEVEEDDDDDDRSSQSSR